MRGLKLENGYVEESQVGRTLTGAWIETAGRDGTRGQTFVAPSRVRGLKQ